MENRLTDTVKADRVHIGFFGRCNAGKSTIINQLTGQPIAIVSSVAGTTTDPVDKAMEILPLGPVLLIDTAGIDDTSPLGRARIEKTKSLVPKMNLAVYVLRSDQAPTTDDIDWLHRLQAAEVPTLLVINEISAPENPSADAYMAEYGDTLPHISYIGIDGNQAAIDNEQRKSLLKRIGQMNGKDSDKGPSLLDGVIHAGDHVLLVCPIDSAAPKGRLILPQVQMIRDVLDHKALVTVVQTEEVPKALSLSTPTIVITDSQAFGPVSKMVPLTIPLTSFSILMARFKGRLDVLLQGVKALKSLHAGSKVLISEGCTHHRQCDDIGTVKIPKWLADAGYKDLDLQWTSGGAFPENLSSYDLVIHCGACMLTRREMLRRMDVTVEQGVPIVNYGLLIAYLHGILDRAVAPFVSSK